MFYMLYNDGAPEQLKKDSYRSRAERILFSMVDPDFGWLRISHLLIAMNILHRVFGMGKFLCLSFNINRYQI